LATAIWKLSTAGSLSVSEKLGIGFAILVGVQSSSFAPLGQADLHRGARTNQRRFDLDGQHI
jgi:hypothetical protein